MKASFLLGFVLLALLIAGVATFAANSFGSHKLNLSNNSKGAILQISFVDPTGDPVDDDFAPMVDTVDNDAALI